jgi:hypothetical protein
MITRPRFNSRVFPEKGSPITRMPSMIIDCEGMERGGPASGVGAWLASFSNRCLLVLCKP